MVPGYKVLDVLHVVPLLLAMYPCYVVLIVLCSF